MGNDYMDSLLDRLNAETAVSGALYVSLIALWTTAVDKEWEVDPTMMTIVAEAIHHYERMHIPEDMQML